jgi:putative oxidoreductase
METSKCACFSKLAGRILFGVPILVFGAMHFMAGAEMNAYVPAFLPAPTFFVYLTGLVLVVAGLAILFNKYVDWMAGILGIMLLSFALLIHLPMVMAGDQAAMSNLLKDTALAGAALYFAGVCCYKNCDKGSC